MSAEQQLRQALGLISYMAVKEAMKRIEISIDADDRTVTVYRDNSEPVRFTFEQLESFVNNVY